MNLENIWRKEPIVVPKSFAGRVPLYQVIASYVHKNDREGINVDRAFCNCQESTRLFYKGPCLTELVTIQEGQIIFVDSRKVVRANKIPDPRTKRGHAILQRIFNPPKTPVPTYHNIKSYDPSLTVSQLFR